MKFSVFIKYLIIFFITLNITHPVKADLASDLLKKAQELADKKKITGKKLKSFILSNIITVDYFGKEQTYKFNKDITYRLVLRNDYSDGFRKNLYLDKSDTSKKDESTFRFKSNWKLSNKTLIKILNDRETGTVIVEPETGNKKFDKDFLVKLSTGLA